MTEIDPQILLEESIISSLETYSNVHRGSGHKSMITTALYEKAREIVLDYLALDPRKNCVIFCSPDRVSLIESKLKPGTFHTLSSNTYGLSVAVRAIAARKGALPGGPPPHSGGGAAKLISGDWVIWAGTPDKFEAGTPAIINVIAFVRALQICSRYGDDIFKSGTEKKLPVKELLYSDLLEPYRGKELLSELRKTRIGIGVKVPTAQGERDFIHLDNSASTSTFRPVWTAFQNALFLDENGSAGVVDQVTGICADFLNAPPDAYDILFTSNTTEAINLLAGRLTDTLTYDFEPVLVSTLMEHSSNDLPWRTHSGHSVVRAPIDKAGFIDLAGLTAILEDYNEKHNHGNRRVTLVAVSAASNVLGTCNNLEEITGIVHRFGAEIVVDGAQLVAHRKVDMASSGIDYFACSAHKVYAPFGCGVLVARKGRFEVSSNENSAGIAALGKSLLLLERIGMHTIEEHEQRLTAMTLQGMKGIPGLEFYGIRGTDGNAMQNRVGVIAFTLKDVLSFRVGKELATIHGIGIRVGCHCAHMLVKYILDVGPGLERFQRVMQTLIPGMSFPGVARVSFGIENTEKDVEKLITAIRLVSSKRSMDGARKKEAEQRIGEFKAECMDKVFGVL